jgi:hypothetical protein
MKNFTSLWLIPAVLLTGCTINSTVSMKQPYHLKKTSPAAGTPVMIAPVTETFPEPKKGTTATNPAQKDSTYLGRALKELFAYGPVPMIPYVVAFYEYKSDKPRTEFVRDAVAARLQARGIPSELLAEEAGLSSLKDGRFGLSVKLRNLKTTSKSSFMSIIIISFMQHKESIATVDVDCELWQGGKSSPIWSGSVQAVSTTKVGNGMAANIFADASAKAVDQCIVNSGLADMRARTTGDTFALLTEKARALEDSNPERSIELYSQAYRNAPDAEQVLSSIQSIGRVARANPRPIPESAKDLMARGKALVSLAKSHVDFANAAKSMEEAVGLAPEWAQGHFNTALAKEAAGQWGGSAWHLKIYLALSPEAKDREKVRMKLAELQLREERGDKPDAISAE